ncbi:MAG TPA: septal ring lytic transglycosylase RlpA family protein [Candidatus Bathyarchaeia archaeon]|nr:septal ring lytic transglycosylase RlpA family protein [Candidatus Bathyarchaeia archaeon]
MKIQVGGAFFCAPLFLFLVCGCGTLGGYREKGLASWYGEEYQGRTTASGERFDFHKKTAAHKKLPFGSVVRVKRRDNGRETVVYVNDRGPFIRGRIIDLSKAAAEDLDMIRDGIAPVRIKVVRRPRG